MRFIIYGFILLLILSSCSKTPGFPEKIAERINGAPPLKEKQASYISLNAILQFVLKYQNRDESFNLQAFEENWQFLSEQDAPEALNADDLKIWVAATGLLLELTQNEKYAAALERISATIPEAQDLIVPFIFTQNNDHIYVNLFEANEIKYGHSLGGDVVFRQESGYPNSGSIKLHFSMTERRYIELYIRIPEWAEGSTVTVKQVKYFAAPGEYCKIAKKWKEGDVVELELPVHKRL